LMKVRGSGKRFDGRSAASVYGRSLTILAGRQSAPVSKQSGLFTLIGAGLWRWKL
jgi:hypothetical protein